jgi:hypothetical protein
MNTRSHARVVRTCLKKSLKLKKCYKIFSLIILFLGLDKCSCVALGSKIFVHIYNGTFDHVKHQQLPWPPGSSRWLCCPLPATTTTKIIYRDILPPMHYCFPIQLLLTSSFSAPERPLLGIFFLFVFFFLFG